MTAQTETPRAAGSCCSSGADHGAAPTGVAIDTVTAVYEVTGMTCGHCEGAVAEEISAIDGVTEVKAVASTGQVTVSSRAPLTEEAVRAAVDEAGYEYVGRA
ncbi:heavy-metal-associated domain-containing protein [Streptomyces sp. AM 2-1-1]|uniref:heavy-metal-associated domain-containing protein n=1 Tax=unclassified Streptomyces TaxID=2593676 RepID=UPI0023B92E04|nr:heavy-metal-associated domain-containing protein [Streptomyces sp. AM 2-1-1]WEH41745.1 heavy-metal-associated domain-containing protein [Streptomyces sp. AM 2-1-1]